MTVTVYTQPSCPACTLTKRQLDKLGIAYAELPIDDDVRVRAEAAGIMSAPIVEAIGHPPFGGFRPDRLNALAG